MTQDEIAVRFSYHAPTDDQVPKYNALRNGAKGLATLIADLVPESREQSLAVTKLEEAVMFANAGIARRTEFDYSDPAPATALSEESVETEGSLGDPELSEAIILGDILRASLEQYRPEAPGFIAAIKCAEPIFDLFWLNSILASLEEFCPDDASGAILDSLDWLGFFEHLDTMASQYEEDSGQPMTLGEFRYAVGYSIREKLIGGDIDGFQPGDPITAGAFGKFLRIAADFAITWARLDGCNYAPKIRYNTDTGPGPGISTPPVE